LKLAAVEDGTTMSAIVVKLVDDWLSARQRKGGRS
jgi:hypothetical protein